MNNPTLKKIAEMLGISVSTVSRALKMHPDISESTRSKVAELAKMLDYEPNANAVHLRTRNSRIFGILVPSISNYFYESFISSIEEEGRKSGYSIMILQSGNNPEIETENLKLFRQNRISGLFACITPDTNDFSGYDKMREQDIPVVYFDKVPDRDKIRTVCLADEQAATIAAAAIVNRNKKNVLAFFGNDHISITQKRKKAFTTFFQQNASGISLQYRNILSSEEARKMVHEAWKTEQKADTIFCMSDEILIGVTKALQELNLSVSEDVSVIAISNGFIPKLFYPEITYVETSGEKLGKLAFSEMMDWLAGNHNYSENIVEAVLVEGGSL